MNLKKNQLSVVFFGTPEFAVPALQKLLDHNYSITVVTAPDKPTGRKKIMTASPVKQVAETAHLPILIPEKIDTDFIQLIEQLKPDIAVIVAYGKILPAALLKIPKFGFLNIHPSLLPKYRGASPIQSAILNGENQTGVSIMLIDEEVDHGPVLAVEYYDIAPDMFYSEMARELSEVGAELLEKTLPKYISGEIQPQPQNHSEATHSKKFSLDDGRIDWTRPTEMTYNQFRALAHEPGVWTRWNGKILKIIDAKPLNTNIGETVAPGTILETNGRIVVRTGSYYLELLEVKLEGSRAMKIKEFVAGHPDFIGSVLS
jgi:methionyl-tRNA formyltransferase